MRVYINNELQELQEHASVTDVLSVLNINAQKGVAVAINNNVIPRTEWDYHAVQAEDKITLIKATQGG